MTTLHQYEGLDEIVQALQAVRSRRWSVRLLTGVLAVVAVTGTAALVGALVTGFWPGQPPQALRWALLGVVCLSAAFSLVWFLLRAAVWRQNLAQTARFVEGRLPDLHNDLINSVLLARDAGQPSPELVQQAIAEAAERAANIDSRRAVPVRSLRRWLAAATLVVALLSAFAVASPGRFGRGFRGLMAPEGFVPTVNTLELVRLSPGDAKVFAGTPVEIAAEIKNPRGEPRKAVILLRAGGEHEMDASPDFVRFSRDLGPQDQTFEYAVQIGASRWPTDRPWYKVTVIDRIGVQRISARYEFPLYTGLKPVEVPKFEGNVIAVVGSKAVLTVRLGETVPAAQIEIRGQPAAAMGLAADGVSFTAETPIESSGGYRLTFFDDSRRPLLQLPPPAGASQSAAAAAATGAARMMLEGYYPITAQADDPPKVELLSPARDTSAAPGSKLAVKVKASDRFGLTAIELWAGKENQPRLVQSVQLAGKTEETQDFTLPLDGLALGDLITCFATATDNRDLPATARLSAQGPQTSRSSPIKIVIQDPNAAAEQSARRLEEIRKRMMAILKLQEEHRVNTELCRRQHADAAQVKATGARIAAGQKAIRAQMLDLIQNVPFEGDLVTIQQAVALLAQNEAQIAIDQAGLVEKLASFDERENVCKPLSVTQDRIITVLQDLLSIMPSLASTHASAQKTGPGADLPPEVREKLKDLADNLKKFMEDQRRAIKASEGLAKKSVDQLSPEDQKILNDLKALQDKWEKFLEEALSDFSKLAQQDFSNPQLLKELISVKSDVTMAKDALAQKAQEIATALEDNGIENAKSLTANLEKWLPDVPDRQQWKMENPTDETQMKTEQPNLPSELEDLVGDLLEEEEDLFQEMQDQTAKYNQSGDKGIGWDAMDGPISNMNAQGVTGNQLPNSNELSGRSGEGRQGKASGEFVEDKAVGKGGRRTPTRLTPEPFQKGEINDQSTEPAGGSTGGGKLSGSGGEGLEGPLPPPLQKEMQRLAGRQADLVSRGRKFLEGYKQGDYAGFKLLQTVTLLDQVRDDLENNRYMNALRQKQTIVESLSQTKLAITKDVKVTTDTSSQLPKYVQDGINDAMTGKVPEEFRDVIEEYRKRLSENK